MKKIRVSKATTRLPRTAASSVSTRDVRCGSCTAPRNDARTAVQVDVAAGECYDPGDDPNPATSVAVTDPPF